VSVFGYRGLVTPDIFKSLLEAVLGFVLLLGDEGSEALLYSSISHLESPDRLLQTHGDGVEVLDFVDLGLESVTNLHFLLACIEGPTEIHSVQVNLSLVKVEQLFVDVESQLVTFVDGLDPENAFIFLITH